MRYDPEHKRRTREKVLQIAAQAIRAQGPDKISIVDLMEKAGLTHGGFYAHFRSKDQLIAEAISQMFDDRFEAFQKFQAGQGLAESLTHYVDLYLGTQHRDQRHSGCPLPALAGDLPRLPIAARKRFEAGAKRMTDSIADVLAALKRPNPHALAVSVLCEMVGAIVIARAIANKEMSERVLNEARDSVKARIGLNA